MEEYIVIRASISFPERCDIRLKCFDIETSRRIWAVRGVDALDNSLYSNNLYQEKVAFDVTRGL
jgi:hypothetical protein